MKAFRIISALLFVIISCSKDSNSDKEYEDPPYYGYMEAKVNGELKKWEAAIPSSTGYCNWSGCVEGCTNRVSSSYLAFDVASVPEITESISIRWDLGEDWGCEGYNARFSIIEAGEFTDFDSREICDDGDPTTSLYLCHEVSFTITHVGDNIYRGTFSFVASRNCGEEEVIITDGKFEIKSVEPLCDLN